MSKTKIYNSIGATEYRVPITEASAIREELKFYWNITEQYWELYTFIFNLGFRWIKISDDDYWFFVKAFNPPTVFVKH